MNKTTGKLAIVFTLTNLCLAGCFGAFSERAIAGEPNTAAVDLGEPLTMNCQQATLTGEYFFFVEQDGQQIAVDCATIVVPVEQKASTGEGQFIKPKQEGLESPPTLPTLTMHLDHPAPPSDRLILFQERL